MGSTKRGRKTELHWAVIENVSIPASQSFDDINAKDELGRSALHWAAALNKKDWAQCLMEPSLEADWFLQDYDGRTPLHEAAINGYGDIVELFVRNSDMIDKINIGDNFQRTALQWAMENDEFNAEARFYRCHMWGHKREGSDIMDPILPWGSLLYREMLLNAGDGPDLITPLAYAAREGLDAVVQLLLSQKLIMVDVPDSWGQTPLIHAAIKGQEAILSQLIDKDADINATDRKLNTPLMHAVETGHEGVVRRLLLYDHINVDARNYTNSTALKKAAGRGNEEVVKQLLDKGANVEQGDVDQAHVHGHKNVEELLQEQLRMSQAT
ncbi:hypothetical protein PG989_010899 [Apiospora arundinis]